MRDDPLRVAWGLVDRAAIAEALDENGSAVVQGLLPADLCQALAGLYEVSGLFRSTVVMDRHGFGRGEYKYLRYPLPAIVSELREGFYGFLSPIANRWNEAMGSGIRYPTSLGEFLARCRAAEQTQPTPLLLRYGPGDYNCLHQDLYGETVFPLQLAVLLSDPAAFAGGEFILTEQRPRMQSRAEVVPLSQGDAVIFPVNERPILGTRGVYRVRHRHGVSRVRSGQRVTLGIIFHDAPSPAGMAA